MIDKPIAALSKAAAAAIVLDGVGPLTATELVVNLKERGYRADDDPRIMLTSLRDTFKRNRGGSRGERMGGGSCYDVTARDAQ